MARQIIMSKLPLLLTETGYLNRIPVCYDCCFDVV